MVIRVALDAMGGDRAPAAIVAGALEAVTAGHGALPGEEQRVEHSSGDDEGVRLVLVGDRARIDGILDAAGAEGRVDVRHAGAAIPMDVEPALAVRSTPDASVRVVMQMIADGVVEAGVSAGSTGATIAAALLGLGRIAGVRRPAIAGALPVAGPAGQDVVLVDAGASPDVVPGALLDWARLGCAYARARGASSVDVGLLNVGTEGGKGNELTRSAHTLLTEWVATTTDGAVDVRFHGNVEPRDVLAGTVDVVVTDGFTGNVFIKTLEAAFADRAVVPPGALVLGVRGAVVVAHGAADAPEIVEAVRTAAAVVRGGWLQVVGRSLE